MEDKPKATPDEQVNSGVETLKETRKTVVSASTDTLRTANVTERVPSVLDIFDELDEAPQRAANGTGATASKPIPASFLPGEGKAKTGSNKLPPKRPAQVDAHQRKVSWGGFEEAMNSHGNPPARKNVQQPNIQQPFLGDQDGSVSPVSLDEGRVLYSSENRPRGNRKISVDDLVRRSPMEAEAETYIIRALEERDPTRSRADSSGAPPVLSNVTDEAISNFSSNDENTSNATPFDERVPSSRSAGTTSRVAKPTHRRMHTVEQELAGLTSAIDAFHNMEVVVPEDQAPPSPLGRGRINTLDTQGIAGLEIPMSSAEAFHNNASILLHRTKAPTQDDTSGASAGDEEDSQAPSIGSTLTTSASVRWRKLKHVLKAGTSSNTTSSNTKKDDGDVIVEEEIGMEDEEAMEDTISNGRINTENIEPEAFASENINGSNRNLKTTKVTAGYSPFFKEVQDFFGPRRNSIYAYFKIMGTYVFLPTIGVAAILFHLADNPPIGILANGGKPVNGTLMNTDGEVVDPGVASASWWLLFLGVRQLFTFTLSKATELFVIDFLCIRSKFMLRLTGPWFTLLLLQSRGWPILLVFWSLLDFALLSGTKRFFAHWLYWQDVFELFNESNPSGDVVNSDWNHRILAIAASVGAVVCAKRFWMGQYLGRQTFAQYAEKLADVMNKILLVSEVAKLSRDFQKFTEGTPVDALDADELDGLLKYSGDDPSADGRSQRNRSASAEAFSTTGASRVVDPEDVNPLTGQLNSSQKVKIAQLLGAWEEPMVAAKPAAVASIDSILQFRTALSLLKTNYPFSALFGLADTRENCVLSSQEVYERLLLKTPDKEVLSFEILALLGVNKNGSLNNNKLRQLVRLFRPDREGDLDCIDFVKSVDVVYKELRLLRAAVANSSKIDHAFETIINIIFYIIVTTVILSQLGFDPLALFLSISGVILAFAFMIGSASSKYFEGLLFVLVRRPYTIGDGIHVSNIEQDTAATGSAWWTVEDINLYTTSVVFMFTNEKATLSNGSLANSRIINVTRSREAYLYILLKFSVDVAYERVEIFHNAIEKYVKNRPREWLNLNSFRATRVEAAQGFIEYIVVGQHRESWANWGALMMSKAQLASFSVELSKKLGMTFRSPPLPVDLSIIQPVGNPSLLNPASFLNQSGAPPGGGDERNMAAFGASPDLTSLQARFAPAPTSV